MCVVLRIGCRNPSLSRFTYTLSDSLLPCWHHPGFCSGQQCSQSPLMNHCWSLTIKTILFLPSQPPSAARLREVVLANELWRKVFWRNSGRAKTFLIRGTRTDTAWAVPSLSFSPECRYHGWSSGTHEGKQQRHHPWYHGAVNLSATALYWTSCVKNTNLKFFTFLWSYFLLFVAKNIPLLIHLLRWSSSFSWADRR